MADKRIDQLVAATTLGNNDLLVLEQNNQAKKMSGATLASFVYNAATDKIAEVNQAVADAQDAVDSLEEQKNTIAEAIASMADLGTDTTLSTTGMAADAKATGDRINDAETAALAGLDQGNISGVAIASFDDGADDVPVKALKIAIEPQQDLHGYANPWPAGGGKNLLETTLASGTQSGLTWTVKSDGTITLAGSASTTVEKPIGDIELAAGTTYKLNGCPHPNNAFRLQLKDSGGNVKTTSFNNGDSEFTITETGVYTLSFVVTTQAGTISATLKPMIRLATNTDAIFAPYSNICPITGWAGVNVISTALNLWDEEWEIGGLAAATGANWATNDRIRSKNYVPIVGGESYYINSSAFLSTLCYYNASKNFISGAMSVAANSVITAPIDARYLRFSEANTYGTTYKNDICINISDPAKNGTYEPYQGETYSIAFPLSAGTVYGGTLDVSNGVLTVDRASVDLGTLTWKYISNGVFYATDLGIKYSSNNSVPVNAICSKYPVVSYTALTNDTSTSQLSGYINDRIYLRDNNYSDADAFKTAMSGVYLVYELATPITYTLTPPVVRTLLATNNILADTGNILDLIYRRQPISDADIQENINAIRDAIADREDSGVASKNYAGGSLILIGDTLYETAGPITTGESLVPGSNCTATTVAAQIAYIKSIINGLGNLAYLSYENA